MLLRALSKPISDACCCFLTTGWFYKTKCEAFSEKPLIVSSDPKHSDSMFLFLPSLLVQYQAKTELKVTEHDSSHR